MFHIHPLIQKNPCKTVLTSSCTNSRSSNTTSANTTWIETSLSTGDKLSWKTIHLPNTLHALYLSYFTMFGSVKEDSSNNASLSMMILWEVGWHILHPLTSSPYQRSTCLIWDLLRVLIKKHKHHSWIISHLSNY